MHDLDHPPAAYAFKPLNGTSHSASLETTHAGTTRKAAPAARTPNILVTNAMALNGGDAAILQATLSMLRAAFGAATSVTVYDMRASAAARYYPELSFRPQLFSEIERLSKRRIVQIVASLGILTLAHLRHTSLGQKLSRRLPHNLQQSLADYAEADLIVSSGGTYLVPHYEVYSKIFDFLVALALRRPLVLFTQSLGPFQSGKRRLLLRYVFRRAHLILARDEKSLRQLQDLGIPGDRVRLCADAAFALAPAGREGRSLPASRNRWRVAISVRDWPHFRNQPSGPGMEKYLTSVASLTEYLVERYQAEITFISTCQGTPEYWTDDGQTAERVVRRLPEHIADHVKCDRAFHTPERLIDRLAQHDFVVTTRLHAGILSLCAGTPVLPIAYEFKTRELFERLGLGEATLDIEEVSPERLTEAFERAAAFWRSQAEEIWSKVAEERLSALAAVSHLAALAAADGTQEPGAATSA